jgi:hypothetical protein
VDSSTWIAVGALAVAAVSPVTAALQSSRQEGQREGKLDSAITRLTEIAEDHEARLRKGRL